MGIYLTAVSSCGQFTGCIIKYLPNLISDLISYISVNFNQRIGTPQLDPPRYLQGISVSYNESEFYKLQLQ